MPHSKRRMLREGIFALALIATTGMTLRLLALNASGRERLAETESSSLRANTEDQLVGRTLALLAINEPEADKAAPDAKPILLWVLDLERCSGCLDAVSQWTRLEQLLDYRFVVVVVGTPSPEARTRLRVMRKTRVVSASDESVTRMIGRRLPSTKLLLTGEGVVLLADSRAAGQNCGWSFEAQVGVLMGVLPPASIRTSSVADE